MAKTGKNFKALVLYPSWLSSEIKAEIHVFYIDCELRNKRV